VISQDVSKRAFVSRSKINANWSRFETRARKHYYTSVDSVYMHTVPIHALCFFPPLFSIFRQLFSTRIPFGRVSVGMCVSACSRGKNAKRGGRMDSATRFWCNCMLIERASEYGIRMAVRFDIAFCLRSSSTVIHFFFRHLVISSVSISRCLFPRRFKQRERGCSDTA